MLVIRANDTYVMRISTFSGAQSAHLKRDHYVHQFLVWRLSGIEIQSLQLDRYSMVVMLMDGQPMSNVSKWQFVLVDGLLSLVFDETVVDSDRVDAAVKLLDIWYGAPDVMIGYD